MLTILAAVTPSSRLPDLPGLSASHLPICGSHRSVILVVALPVAQICCVSLGTSAWRGFLYFIKGRACPGSQSGFEGPVCNHSVAISRFEGQGAGAQLATPGWDAVG